MTTSGFRVSIHNEINNFINLHYDFLLYKIECFTDVFAFSHVSIIMKCILYIINRINRINNTWMLGNMKFHISAYPCIILYINDSYDSHFILLFFI